MRVVWSSEKSLENVSPSTRVDRCLSAPHVGQHRGERITDRAQDVAGVLGRELLAERLVLFPGLRDVVPELVEQGLVVPEHHRRQVVADTVDVAVDRDRVERAGGVAVEPLLVDHALVERRGVSLNAIGLLGRPAGIVHLRGPHHVGPTFACLVEERDLGVERVATTGVPVVRLDVHLDLGVVLLERLDDGRAVGVHPDRDRAVLDLLGGWKSVLASEPVLSSAEQPAAMMAMDAAAAVRPITRRKRVKRRCCGDMSRVLFCVDVVDDCTANRRPGPIRSYM